MFSTIILQWIVLIIVGKSKGFSYIRSKIISYLPVTIILLIIVHFYKFLIMWNSENNCEILAN